MCAASGVGVAHLQGLARVGVDTGRAHVCVLAQAGRCNLAYARTALWVRCSGGTGTPTGIGKAHIGFRICHQVLPLPLPQGNIAPPPYPTRARRMLCCHLPPFTAAATQPPPPPPGPPR